MSYHGKGPNHLIPACFLLVSPPVIFWYFFYVPAMLKYPRFAKCNVLFHSNIFRDILFPMPKEVSTQRTCHLLGLALMTPVPEVPLDPSAGGKVLLSSSLPSEDTSAQDIFVCLISPGCKLFESSDYAFFIALGVPELYTVDVQQMSSECMDSCLWL